MVKFATNASGAIWWSNLQLMQVAPSGGQICNRCKWCHLVAFGTNASGILLLAGEITQVKEAIAWVRCASGNVSLIHAKFRVWNPKKVFSRRPVCLVGLLKPLIKPPIRHQSGQKRVGPCNNMWCMIPSDQQKFEQETKLNSPFRYFEDVISKWLKS